MIKLALMASIIAGCYWGPGLYRNINTWWAKEVRFPLTSVSVEGNHYLPDDSLLAMASLPMGTSVFDINLSAKAHTMEQHPWIERVRLFLRLPSTVVIRIKEVEPLALIPGNPMGVVGSNNDYLGTIWKGVTWDLPLLAGLKIGHLKIGEQITSDIALTLINCALMIRSSTPEVFQIISDFRLKDDYIFLTLEDGKSQVQAYKNAQNMSWQVLKEFLINSRRDFAEQSINIDLRFPQWVIISPING